MVLSDDEEIIESNFKKSKIRGKFNLILNILDIFIVINS